MRVLILSTWFPYPLSQGSKIRAYYLIKSLAQRHDVALVSFEDVPLEPGSIDHVEQICRKVEVVHRNPFARSRKKTLSGWLSQRPSVVQTSYCPEMAARVQHLASDWDPECVIALTFITAPYALAVHGAPRIVDIDNLMWPMLKQAHRQAQDPFGRLRSWVAYWKFRQYETWLYRQFDLSLVVSDRDRQAAVDLMGLQVSQVGVVPNGVDMSFHQPLPIEPKPNTLVYNGALTYAANYDAMDYFLREIFPLIRAQVPETRLTITGATTGVPIAALPTNGHVTFSGYLKDIRPEVSSSWVCVVPLRLGGGTRLKILEAMALGTPVVSTSKGAEGLDIETGKHLLIGNTPSEFAAQTVRVLREPGLRTSLGAQGAQLVKDQYDWANIGRHFCQLVENA
jgi:glycosyltransferase involved in cell wall biosynthesis